LQAILAGLGLACWIAVDRLVTGTWQNAYSPPGISLMIAFGRARRVPVRRLDLARNPSLSPRCLFFSGLLAGFFMNVRKRKRQMCTRSGRAQGWATQASWTLCRGAKREHAPRWRAVGACSGSALNTPGLEASLDAGNRAACHRTGIGRYFAV